MGDRKSSCFIAFIQNSSLGNRGYMHRLSFYRGNRLGNERARWMDSDGMGQSLCEASQTAAGAITRKGALEEGPDCTGQRSS
jgi:hypothetical protein